MRRQNVRVGEIQGADVGSGVAADLSRLRLRSGLAGLLERAFRYADRQYGYVEEVRLDPMPSRPHIRA